MPKPTTGRVQPPAPEPDTEQLTTDTLMTSVFTGLSLIVATLILGAAGGLGALTGDQFGSGGWRFGLAVGLLVGMGLIAVVLRTYASNIKARSANLYRGAWIGSFLSLGIILVMAYAPWLMPSYCPPGAMC